MRCKLALALFCLLLTAPAAAQTDWGYWAVPDASCNEGQAWIGQQHPRSDPTGLRNVAYPEGNATYWGMVIAGEIGTSLTIRGQFPAARYMGIQVYDAERNVRGAIADHEIVPDPGENNPFVPGSSAALGHYSVTLVFGPTPEVPAQNTLYSDGLSEVGLAYRIYYANDPEDLPGGTSDPVLPDIIQGGVTLSTCPPRPVLPEDETINGVIDDEDYQGTPPDEALLATNPPKVSLTITNPATPYYPSADNNYITIRLSREYLAAPYAYNMLVMRMRAPSFANTQKGAKPYSAEKNKQVRFWSVCSDDPVSTGVVRCVPDAEVRKLDGMATFVISDPSFQPSKSALKQWGANWIPWGALPDGEVVYDIDSNQLSNEDGVFYGNLVLYRQTLANPSWEQSMASVGQLPRSEWQSAMGDYWPQVGYCTAAAFTALGADCIAP